MYHILFLVRLAACIKNLFGKIFAWDIMAYFLQFCCSSCHFFLKYLLFQQELLPIV